MSNIYRIYTENINDEKITDFLDNNCPETYFIYASEVLFKGQSEPCIIIEIIGKTDQYNLIRDLALKIKEINNQENIIMTWQQINMELL